MPRIEIDLKPVLTITVSAIGKPGHRIFYIQGISSDQIVTLLVEKSQIQTMAVGAEEFLTEIATRYPDLPEASMQYDEEKMHIIPPVDPLFRIGDLGLTYESEEDKVVLLAREIQAEDSEPDTESLVRFWCTRSQIRALAHWSLEVANRGRPICPLCGEPMDPDGHFCPKKNGHKH